MCTKLIFLLFISIQLVEFTFSEVDNTFNYQCFPRNESVREVYAGPIDIPIVIQLSNHVLNQVVSRIFAIYFKEILGYRNTIELKELNFPNNTSEESKIRLTMENIVSSIYPTINVGVWMLTDHHSYSSNVKTIGLLATGRFGWFIPNDLIGDEVFPELYPYTMFQRNDTKIFKEFILESSTIQSLKEYSDKSCNICTNDLFIPPQCNSTNCVTLLAPQFTETSFVIHHILELNLYVNVLWLGDRLKPIINILMKNYTDEQKKDSNYKQKFMVLHWTPSEVINSTITYKMITMPRCEEMESSSTTRCKYELTSLLNYYSSQDPYSKVINMALGTFFFNDYEIGNVFQLYDTETNNSQLIKLKDVNKTANSMNYKLNSIYNNVACQWLKTHKQTREYWKKYNSNEKEIYIGGIFPEIGSKSGILPAVDMAISDINKNGTILSYLNLTYYQSDGQCQSNSVMTAFINYIINRDRILGVLGPACSETVEPIAGLSKVANMPIISYSAEGVSFLNRSKYPYFFRTTGENQQYELVYLRLFQHFNWTRVAALNEDGKRSTEYISHMETMLQKRGIELIVNKKFHRQIKAEEMSWNLMELKRKNIFIIIADIYDDIARIVMCEAHKLQMTAKNGYVWFLPKNLLTITKLSGYNGTCTEKMIKEMLNGHLSLSHAPFAAGTAIMQNGQSVTEWRSIYDEMSLVNGYYKSDYAGYAYDAIWVYALALDSMIKENSSYLSNLHSNETTKRLIELIDSTDFNGVSGRIRFGKDGTRFSVINILQWFDGQSNIVGTFYPIISESEKSQNRKLIGGELTLDIHWPDNSNIPSDGTIICSLDKLAKLINTDCSSAVTVLTSLICLILLIIVSITSFLFWKKRYDKKIKQTVVIMRRFPFPFDPLDKWEVPKDRLVINRQLGEGAFGMVYGGEAQINKNTWTPVAVKTMKSGSTIDNRLDFLSEAEAMKRFDHKNIVKLLGVCLQTEPIYTIMEFMLYGNLKTFLLARRDLVYEKVHDESDVSPKRLTAMLLDVAQGLSYLAKNKYVHRDIACRNCLVNAQRVVKLSDFGMTRPVTEKDYYKFTRKGLLPIRWMAPESIESGIFTPASDIWSFGVLIYEIITFGSFPFQAMTNNQVIEHIKMGKTLNIPIGVKPPLDGLMKACWNLKSECRPTASEISDFINKYSRLVNPCLDVPMASVEMTGTDSGVDLLPGLRKESLSGFELQKNGVIKSLTSNNLIETCCSSYPNGITLTKFNALPGIPVLAGNCSFTSEESNAYNPIEPLLHNHEEVFNVERNLPMCGFRRSNRSLENTSVVNP